VERAAIVEITSEHKDYPVESEQGSPEVYGRFMGGSDPNTDNPGRFEQFGHCMHIAQSRINTGDCATR
jgi:hypothetical protein